MTVYKNEDTKKESGKNVLFIPEPPNPISEVSATELHKRFLMIGAVSLLAKHFPAESERHNTILALAGTFGRSGVKLGKATAIIGLAYRHSQGYNGDRAKAVSDVKSVYKTLDRSQKARLYGYTKLTEIMPQVVIDKVLELLGIERPETTHTLNDAGNGRRLVQKYQDDIRYCVDDREWYVWDRIRWQK